MCRTLLIVLLLLSLPALSYSQPAVHFNELRHDFGKVVQADSIAYVFEFSNTGNEPLIIEKLTSS